SITLNKLAAGAVSASAISDGSIDTPKLAHGAVDTDVLARAAVDTTKLARGAVDTSILNDSAVTAKKLFAGAVDTNALASGAVTVNKLGAGAVDTNILASGAVTVNKLGSGAVDTGALGSGSVTSSKILAGAVDTGAIGSGSITLNKLAAGAVSASAISDGSIDTLKLAHGAVDTDILARASVDTSKLLRGAVDTSILNDSAVTAKKLFAGAVDTNALASGAVTVNKLGAGAVDTGALGSGAVTSNKILAGAVDTGAIGSGAVTVNKIKAGAVDTGVLASDAVSAAKLLPDTGSLYKVTGGLMSVNSDNIGVGTSSSDRALVVRQNAGNTIPFMVTDNTFAVGAPGTGNSIGLGFSGSASLLQAYKTGNFAFDNFSLNYGGGSVGVGTTLFTEFHGTSNPPKLVVSGSDNATTVGGETPLMSLRNTDTTSGAMSGLAFSAFTGGGNSYVSAAIAAVHGTRATNQYFAGQLAFMTSPGSNVQAQERVRIDSVGSVGIGTTSPASRLHVLDGDIRVSTSVGQPSKGVVFQDGSVQVTSAGTLVQTTTLTGTQNDLAVTSARHLILRLNNASLLTITGFSAGNDGDIIEIVSVGAGQVELDHQDSGSSAGNRLINFVTSGNTPLAAGVGTARVVYDATTARWRLVEHEQGAWISPAYSAGDYTASGGGTWTVDSGDVGLYRYYLQGKNALVTFVLNATTISGTVAALNVKLPHGWSVAHTNHYLGMSTGQDGGGSNVRTRGYLDGAVPDSVSISEEFGGNFATGTNAASVFGGTWTVPIN
ncbi:MAG: hypothetical protein HY925_14855, partial [Elusimicrobia bacterium]|nr:hypothetical protein [Elusimicrobiota bacterium]